MDYCMYCHMEMEASIELNLDNDDIGQKSFTTDVGVTSEQNYIIIY